MIRLVALKLLMQSASLSVSDCKGQSVNRSSTLSADDADIRYQTTAGVGVMSLRGISLPSICSSSSQKGDSVHFQGTGSGVPPRSSVRPVYECSVLI